MDTQHIPRNYSHYKSRKNKPRTNNPGPANLQPKETQAESLKETEAKTPTETSYINSTHLNPSPNTQTRIHECEWSWPWGFLGCGTAPHYQRLWCKHIMYKYSGKVIIIIHQIYALSKTFSRSDQPAPLVPIDGYVSWTSDTFVIIAMGDFNSRVVNLTLLTPTRILPCSSTSSLKSISWSWTHYPSLRGHSLGSWTPQEDLAQNHC